MTSYDTQMRQQSPTGPGTEMTPDTEMAQDTEMTQDSRMAQDAELGQDQQMTEREAATGAAPADDALLFSGDDAQSFRERWEQVQSRFVDDPRGAVQDADALVADVTESLTSSFAEQKTSLEQQWSAGDDVETEDLRLTLRRYRELFERLLAA